MTTLEGRVAVITGAGRGIGREHALYFAQEGGTVVVNDLGGSADGSGADANPAQEVVEEIRAAGGRAVANTDDVSSWAGAQRLVAAAIAEFGHLDVVVNNAGIIRDRTLSNMAEDEWDDVLRVHLKGHAALLHFAAAYWKDRAKQGERVEASVINTSSTSGLFGSAGQGNYGAAKSAIATLSMIADLELARYGVRVNAIAPAARTRLTAEILGPAGSGFDADAPENVSPFVAYLATRGCPIHGRVFFVYGGSVQLFQPWAIVDRIDMERRWTVEELQESAARFADVEFDLNRPY